MIYGNQIERYVQTDVDQTGPNYYGYLTATGAWYIVKETVSGVQTSYRYFNGGGGATIYATNWTGRSGLAYDYYNNVFKE